MATLPCCDHLSPPFFPVLRRCAEYVHHAIVQWGTHPRNPLSGSLLDDIEAFIAASVNDGMREVCLAEIHSIVRGQSVGSISLQEPIRRS